ncbi:hypothetical protein LUZ60_016382 [Juncus effusus]|nr:hypothetical protein LUZ60_016382 [Juncus effusus]
MKVQCDVCGIEAAAVFCCADEAALCESCDRRVHRANKVASKHSRFSLLPPSSSLSSSSHSPPLCDICQEKRGFLFCKEDRAIFCRDCDIPIHTSSDLTMKHSRFLLTGLRLSSSPIPSSSNLSETEEEEEEEEEVEKQSTQQCNSYHHNKAISQDEAASCASNNGSSISNYLINMLPGWHVEHLLNDDVASSAYATTASASSGGFYQGEMNENGYRQEYPVWSNQEQSYYQSVAQKDMKVQKQLEIFVPQMQNEWNSNMTRQMPSSYYW